MTTQASEAQYLAEHLRQWEGKGFAVFNPKGVPLADLPVIYGFNNGGAERFLEAHLLAQDGHHLGSHICSHECYMPHDLGVVEGSRPDRHETFRAHYPDGYRMDFVSLHDTLSNPGLTEAIRANAALAPDCVKS